MKNKNWDSDWIHFSKKARRGIFVLLFVYILLAIFPRLYSNYIGKKENYDFILSAIHSTEEERRFSNFEENKTSDSEKSRYKQPEEFFDPNNFSLEQWMQVGLSQKQANSILKYIEKGAEFRVKSDLKKLFVMNDELYALLAPKMLLPDSIPVQNKRENNNFQVMQKDQAASDTIAFQPVSINTATVEELQTIKGIGSFFAKEIIKLRKSFGGIIEAEQLLAIYKMDREKLDSLLPFFKIDAEKVRKLDINTASKTELEKHPWISNDAARSIVFFRENHKKYETLDELLLSPYIDAKLLKKIEPYLKVE